MNQVVVETQKNGSDENAAERLRQIVGHFLEQCRLDSGNGEKTIESQKKDSQQGTANPVRDG